jgi:hypothetical protein
VTLWSRRENPFDALIVGYYEGERLLFAAKVGNGFVPLVRREVASRFKGLEIDTCPFANLPENKRTQWALTKEETKTACGSNPSWLLRSSSPSSLTGARGAGLHSLSHTT